MFAESTCWDLIQQAASGSEAAQEEFVHRYLPAVRAYLTARWRNSRLLNEVDDGTQEVFWQCLRPGGGFERMTSVEGNFRGYLYGMTRNVARMMERGDHQRREEQAPDDLGVTFESDEASLSRVFDQAWSRTLISEAVERQRSLATERGADALQRIEMLRLRFQEDLPARRIADRLGVESTRVHRELTRAREEFRDALEIILREHHGGSSVNLERECHDLLTLLG